MAGQRTILKLSSQQPGLPRERRRGVLLRRAANQ